MMYDKISVIFIFVFYSSSHCFLYDTVLDVYFYICLWLRRSAIHFVGK